MGTSLLGLGGYKESFGDPLSANRQLLGDYPFFGGGD